jgi:predicted adenylyl cyclase CyaB
MAIETEVKIRVSQKKFETLMKFCFGCRSPRFREEKNIFYSIPRGFLRLRSCDEEVFVTYKSDRKKDTNLNCREEIEFDYPEKDFQKLQTFFSRLGFEKYFEYTKLRANYDVEGGMSGGYFATVSFDILPNGNRYLEVEKKEAGSEKIVENLLERFELDKYPREKRSYLEILKEIRCENGRDD